MLSFYGIGRRNTSWAVCDSETDRCRWDGGSVPCTRYQPSRDVAIKVLPERLAEGDDHAVRFQREARVLASLNHVNIGAIYDLQRSANMQFLILELVEGEMLAERISRHPIPFPEAVAFAKQIADELELAHEKGIPGPFSPILRQRWM